MSAMHCVRSALLISEVFRLTIRGGVAVFNRKTLQYSETGQDRTEIAIGH